MFRKLLAISIRSQMQYSVSFLTLCLAHFLATAGYIIGIWALFDRFHKVQGWTFYEVGLLYGIVHISFGIAETFARGFERFSHMLIQGDFDRLLLRPIHPLIQLATHDIQIMRLSRSLQGAIVLAWSLSHLSFSVFSIPMLVILFAIIGTTGLFYGLWVLQAAVAFWTIETLEVFNIVTYGSIQTGQYPMSFYNRSFRFFFTFLVPLSLTAYSPIASLLRYESISLWCAAITPLAGLLFLYLACKFWNVGARHHLSTGS